MKKVLIKSIFVLAFFVTFSAPALVWADGFTKPRTGHFKGSAVKIYSKGYAHIDIGYYVQKLKDIFFTEEFKKKYPQAELVQKFIDTVGYFAIEDYTVESTMANGKIFSRETIYLNESYPDSVISKLAKLEDKHFKIGSLFTEDDYLFLLALNNFQDFGRIVFGSVIETLKEGGQLPPEVGQVMGFLEFFKVREELLASLGTELDLILFDVPDLQTRIRSPADVFFGVLVPVKDFARAEELVKALGGMLGFSVSSPTFESAEWRFFELFKSGIYLGLSGEWLVITGSPKEFVSLVIRNRSKFHEDLPCGNIFIRINSDRLFKELGKPLIEMLRHKNPKLATKEIAYFFDVASDTDFGKIDVKCSYKCDRIITETVMDDDVLNAVFYLLANGLEYAAIEALQKKEREKKVEEEREEEEEKFDSRVPF